MYVVRSESDKQIAKMGIVDTQNKVLLKRELYEATVNVLQWVKQSHLATDESSGVECGNNR